MADHLTNDYVEQYRNREIDPASQREIDAHLAGCNACLDRVLNSQHSAIAVSSLNEALLPSENEAPFHFSEAEMKRYLAGPASEADGVIYESHLNDCAQCMNELAVLTEANAKAVPVIVPEDLPSRTSWPVGTRLTPARAVLAVAIISVAALALILWRGPQTPNEIVRSAPPANSSPGPVNPGPAPQPSTTEIPPAALVVLKDNSREIRLENDGKLVGLEGLDVDTRQTIASLLRGAPLSRPKLLDELVMPDIKLLGPPDANTFRLMSPLSRVLAEDRPMFRWQALSGADSYVVSVFDENFNGVALSPSLTKTQWTANVALKRGHTYTWEVKATKDQKDIVAPAAPVPPAKFRIIDAAQLTDLRKANEQQPVSHLALGTAYARAGMTSEAEREFRELLQENPDSEVAKKLLRTIREWK